MSQKVFGLVKLFGGSLRVAVQAFVPYDSFECTFIKQNTPLLKYACLGKKTALIGSYF